MSPTESTAVRTLLAPFWNHAEDRPRAFWRAVPVAAAALVAIALSGELVAGVTGYGPALVVVQQLPRVVLVLVLLAGVARYVDRRPLADYGFDLDRTWVLDLAAGTAAGVVAHLGAAGTKLAAGWATVDGVFVSPGGAFLPGMALALVGFALVAVWEEALFRGLLLRNAAEGFTCRWLPRRAALAVAVVLVSVVFGVLHVNQAGSLLNVSFWVLLGVVLGVLYAVTGELAAPIGWHFAFNFAGNSVVGIGGAELLPSVLVLSETGPPLLVGVSGLVNLGFALASGVLLVGWVYWRRGDLSLAVELTEWRPRGESTGSRRTTTAD